MAVVPAQSYDSVDFQMDIKVGGTRTVRATPASRVPASPMEAQRLNLIQETVRGPAPGPFLPVGSQRKGA